MDFYSDNLNSNKLSHLGTDPKIKRKFIELLTTYGLHSSVTLDCPQQLAYSK